MFKYFFSFKNNTVISFETKIDIDLHKIHIGDVIAFDDLWINTNEVVKITKMEEE